MPLLRPKAVHYFGGQGAKSDKVVRTTHYGNSAFLEGKTTRQTVHQGGKLGRKKTVGGGLTPLGMGTVTGAGAGIGGGIAASKANKKKVKKNMSASAFGIDHGDDVSKGLGSAVAGVGRKLSSGARAKQIGSMSVGRPSGQISGNSNFKVGGGRGGKLTRMQLKTGNALQRGGNAISNNPGKAKLTGGGIAAGGAGGAYGYKKGLR